MAHVKELKVFSDEVKRGIELFGLHDWSVTTEYNNDIGDNYAMVSYHIVSMKAVITLGKKSIGRTKHHIKQSAIHEVLHLVLAHISIMASTRSFDDELFEGLEHQVINRLTKVILKEEDE